MPTRHCWSLIGFVLLAFSLHADIVKLKDGTVLEGDIVAEDESKLSIYLEFSRGTITQTRQINKDRVAEIIRWTPEEKAEWHAKRDYERLQKYQLNPHTSYPVDYYDQTIDGVFRKFQTEHPDSPYASNISERIVEWKAERNLVAAGNVKFHGWWSPATEGTRSTEGQRGEQLLQQARSLMSQGRFESAVQWLQPILSMSGQPDLVSQAKPLLVSAWQQAITSLYRQRQQLEGDVSSARRLVDQARQTLTEALASLEQVQSSGQSPSGPRDIPSHQAPGDDPRAIAQAQAAVDKARSDLNSAQNHLEQLQSQLVGVTQRLAALNSKKLVETVAASRRDSQPAASPSAPTNAGGSPDLLVGILTWVKDYWLVMALAGLAILLLMSRLAKG